MFTHALLNNKTAKAGLLVVAFCVAQAASAADWRDTRDATIDGIRKDVNSVEGKIDRTAESITNRLNDRDEAVQAGLEADRREARDILQTRSDTSESGLYSTEELRRFESDGRAGLPSSDRILGTDITRSRLSADDREAIADIERKRDAEYNEYLGKRNELEAKINASPLGSAESRRLEKDLRDLEQKHSRDQIDFVENVKKIGERATK